MLIVIIESCPIALHMHYLKELIPLCYEVLDFFKGALLLIKRDVARGAEWHLGGKAKHITPRFAPPLSQITELYQFRK